MISALLVMFLSICLSIVSFVTVVYPLLTVGLAAPPELSTSLLSTAYFVLLFTIVFYSGQRMFLLIAFGVAVHFKQHSSLTYQNLLGFALLHRLRTTDYGQQSSGSWKYGTTELRNKGIESIEQLLIKHSCGSHLQYCGLVVCRATANPQKVYNITTLQKERGGMCDEEQQRKYISIIVCIF